MCPFKKGKKKNPNTKEDPVHNQNHTKDGRSDLMATGKSPSHLSGDGGVKLGKTKQSGPPRGKVELGKQLEPPVSPPLEAGLNFDTEVYMDSPMAYLPNKTGLNSSDPKRPTTSFNPNRPSSSSNLNSLFPLEVGNNKKKKKIDGPHKI